MSPLRRIAACLAITAQVILALAVPGTAAHERADEPAGHRHHRDDGLPCGGHASAAETRLVCRSPAGTWVLGFGSDDHRHDGCDHGGFDCGDGHSHLHVANVDEIGDGNRRSFLPPPMMCSTVDVAIAASMHGPAGDPPVDRDRVARPPPSSRRALGSIVLRV